MSGPTRPEILRRIAEAKKRDHSAFDLGVWLSATSGRSLDDLRDQVVSDRLGFAKEILATADKLHSARPRQNRAAVSRYYYAMYHAMRAVAFFAHGGDDFEAHRELPGKLPDDFPARQYWANALKSARENRNSADYDPYDVPGVSWRSMATSLRAEAPRLINVAEQYLKGKGCAHL